MKHLFWVVFLLFLSCSKDPEPYSDEYYVMNFPEGFPEPVFPSDNYPTISRVKLGKLLFNDPILSSDYSISCASCHIESYAFSDTISFSKGVAQRTGMRNSPSLKYLAWVSNFMRDGGIPTLELQPPAPIQDHNEMDLNIVIAAQRMLNNPEYILLSRKAYNRDPDIYVLTRALAAFMRTLTGNGGKYDAYLYNNGTLTTAVINGMNLFFSDSLNCSVCHSGYLFSDNTFRNNGLYLNYADSGRARITLQDSDKGKFRVPTLRNVQITAPYMHDGSLENLEQVIDHYASGGQGHPNQSNLINGFTLNPQQKNDLISFLNCLTDQ